MRVSHFNAFAAGALLIALESAVVHQQFGVALVTGVLFGMNVLLAQIGAERERTQ
jgi:hypothetical protein